uniref:MARVEL domain-containing protein n=1 Tax=Panagrolaimus sp. JU765 TaxID=591449 RepID=A0AC34QIM0_9BILA
MVHSYSPNGLIEDSEKLRCCCGLMHIKTGGKILAVSQLFLFTSLIVGNFLLNGIGGIGVFISAIGIISYFMLLVVAVFKEIKLVLLPFLGVQGFIALCSTVLALVYGVVGAASDGLSYAHSNLTMVRELYEVHHLDPDDEKIQTLFSCGLMIFLVVFASLQIYVWYIFYLVYKYFKLKDSIIGPERGYQRGKIVADTLNQDY